MSVNTAQIYLTKTEVKFQKDLIGTFIKKLYESLGVLQIVLNKI